MTMFQNVSKESTHIKLFFLFFLKQKSSPAMFSASVYPTWSNLGFYLQESIPCRWTLQSQQTLDLNGSAFKHTIPSYPVLAPTFYKTILFSSCLSINKVSLLFSACLPQVSSALFKRFFRNQSPQVNFCMSLIFC